MAYRYTRVKGVADIVFLIDVTASMQPAIDRLLADISVFFDTLSARGENNQVLMKDWRAKVVAYRDVREEWVTFFEDNPFVRGAEDVKEQFRTLKAEGGGDEPESLLYALYRVCNMKESPKGEEDERRWRSHDEAARVVIVFTDASFHPTIEGGSHAEVMEVGAGTVEDVKNQVYNSRVRLCILAPEMPCHATLAEVDGAVYEAISYDTQKPGSAVEAFVNFTEDKERVRATLETLGRTVTTVDPSLML